MATGTAPDWFRDQVHEVLKNWHEGLSSTLPLRDTILVQTRLDGRFDLPPAEIWQAARAVVEEYLFKFRTQSGLSDEVHLLRRRYLNGARAREVADEQGLSENAIYLRQRRALHAFADALWNEELSLREERAACSAGYLPPQTASRLFGVTEKLILLKRLLADWDGDARVIAVDGIGGIGKTTLANAVAREFLGTTRYTDILWISARRQEFTVWDGIIGEEQPALTFEGLVDALINQLELAGITHLPAQEKAHELQLVMHRRPCLVVVDNLETVADHRALAPRLQPMAAGLSRFLLTSRHSLCQYPGIYSVTLNELSEADALALLRHEAASTGLDELAAAPDHLLRQVYETVGGNPLALKLVVGQAHVLPLPRALDNLREAQGKKAEDLYRYIYWNAWQQLDDDARQVLILMPLFAGEGAELATIEERSPVKGARLNDALERLITLSLVNVGGDLLARRYSIHRLTETFLLQEVIRWQQLAEQP